MREARTLASWVIALIVTVLLVWMAADTLAPQPPMKNHLFQVFRDSSDIAFFEPTGRFAFGVIGLVVAVLVLVPPTRRVGAILGVLLMVGMAALVGQLIMQGITVPVDTVDAAGKVTTANSDPSTILYLVLGVLAASAALIFVHPGADPDRAG